MYKSKLLLKTACFPQISHSMGSDHSLLSHRKTSASMIMMSAQSIALGLLWGASIFLSTSALHKRKISDWGRIMQILMKMGKRRGRPPTEWNCIALTCLLLEWFDLIVKAIKDHLLCHYFFFSHNTMPLEWWPCQPFLLPWQHILKVICFPNRRQT